jgi:hypothetical protein
LEFQAVSIQAWPKVKLGVARSVVTALRLASHSGRAVWPVSRRGDSKPPLADSDFRNRCLGRMSVWASRWHRPLEGQAKLAVRVMQPALAFVPELQLDLPPLVFSTPDHGR